MDDVSSANPEVVDGECKPEATQQSNWAGFSNWARQPASRGFVVGAVSVALALAMGRSSRRLRMPY
jgi:hypothetical protein